MVSFEQDELQWLLRGASVLEEILLTGLSNVYRLSIISFRKADR